MFSWLKFGKKTIPTTHDKVWKSQIIKWKNIEKEYSQDNDTFWVAFFPLYYKTQKKSPTILADNKHNGIPPPGCTLPPQK
jgi:hypothetical protein